MAVNIERLGPYSAALTYGLTDTKMDIYPVMANFIQQQGWELFDDYAENKYVFRAPMSDNADVYKYAELDWQTNAGYLAINVYESWDSSTHKGLNKAAIVGNATFDQAVKTGVWGTVWLFVSPRYLILHNRMQADTGGVTWGTGTNVGHHAWTGLLEISKDNPNEITGEYPRYAQANAGSLAGTNAGTVVGSNGNNLVTTCYALPRSIINTTVSYDTCFSNTVGTIFGRVTNNTSTLLTQLPENANPFDLNTAYSFTLWALNSKYQSSNVPSHIRGRFFGVKALSQSTGSLLDIIKIPCDDEYFYLSEADGGVLKDHLIVSSGSRNPSSDSFRWAIPL